MGGENSVNEIMEVRLNVLYKGKGFLWLENSYTQDYVGNMQTATEHPESQKNKCGLD